MRLIDADALVQMYEELKDRYKDGICCEVLDSIINDINNAPTIEPRKSRPYGDCAKCIHTYGTLGCCITVNNEWVYDCDNGMAQYEITKAEPQLDVYAQEYKAYRESLSAEPAPVVAYICDRRRCAICSGPDGGCDHTTDIKHAAHFKNVAGQYFERPYMEEEDNGKDNDQG